MAVSYFKDQLEILCSFETEIELEIDTIDYLADYIVYYLIKNFNKLENGEY